MCNQANSPVEKKEEKNTVEGPLEPFFWVFFGMRSLLTQFMLADATQGKYSAIIHSGYFHYYSVVAQREESVIPKCFDFSANEKYP